MEGPEGRAGAPRDQLKRMPSTPGKAEGQDASTVSCVRLQEKDGHLGGSFRARGRGGGAGRRGRPGRLRDGDAGCGLRAGSGPHQLSWTQPVQKSLLQEIARAGSAVAMPRRQDLTRFEHSARQRGEGARGSPLRGSTGALSLSTVESAPGPIARREAPGTHPCTYRRSSGTSPAP